MGKLAGSRVYLCGAMDRVVDGGIIWRQKITPVLRDMNIIVLDPSNKPIDYGKEEFQEREYRRLLKREGRYDELAERVKTLRQIDLRLVDVGDFLIVSLDTDIHACGTYEEVFLANRQKKPILIWCNQGKNNVPDWLFGAIPHEMMFDTIEEIIQYIKNIDNGTETNYMNRWVLFDYSVLSI